MNDSQLQRYISHYGDRLAITGFCARLRAREQSSMSQTCTKRLVIDRLRSKLSSDKSGSESRTINVANQFASKTTRRLELGWVHSDDVTQFKQVMLRTGGGTRHLVMNKTSTTADILKVAVELFFPGGTSQRGSADSFDMEVRDFSFKLKSNETTLNDMYCECKLKMLRLFLCTSAKDKSLCSITTASSPADEDDDDFVNAGTPTVKYYL